MKVGHPKCVQMRTGGDGYHALCVRTHLHYLFRCFCLMVSCFICRNLTLPSFKGCVCQKWLFLSNDIKFPQEISLFYFKLFFRTKVSQNAFNFNQIDSKFQCDTLTLKKACAVQHGNLFDKSFYSDIYRACFILLLLLLLLLLNVITVAVS